MATDLAEFIGAAVASSCCSGCRRSGRRVTALISPLSSGAQRRGDRRFEIVITALLAMIRLGIRAGTCSPPAPVPRTSSGASCRV